MFQIFMDHWMIKENEARRALRFKEKAEKIQLFTRMRIEVQQFWEFYDDWGYDDEYFAELKNYALFLGKSAAVHGCCPYCERSVQRFGLLERNGETTCMTISCQDKECQAPFMIMNLSE